MTPKDPTAPGLPVIAPYPLPAAGTLPANHATWKPEPDRAVLLVHDMQRYFLASYYGDRITDR